MKSYSNETKVKDLGENILKENVFELFKIVLMDSGMSMEDKLLTHTINRLTYLISVKHRGLMLGEVKYIFEAMTDGIKGKPSVSAIMSLFQKYTDDKISKQRFEIESKEEQLERQNFVNIFENPMCRAIAYKLQLLRTGRISEMEWYEMNTKDVARKIQSGEIKFHFMSESKKSIRKWKK